MDGHGVSHGQWPHAMQQFSENLSAIQVGKCTVTPGTAVFEVVTAPEANLEGFSHHDCAESVQ